MTITLSSLNARLQATIAPAGGKPTSTQYDQAIKDAVADFGRRCPVTKTATISVVAGTAAYTLPSDFVRVVLFPTIKQLARDGILNTGAGLIPISSSYSERYAARNGTLTLYPTPQYTMTRYLYYAAGFPLTGTSPNESFTDLSEDEVSIALHKAAELVLLQIADGVARQGWSYSLADESVNKTQLAANIYAQAKAEREQYELAIASRAGGTQTVQADYNANEYGSFAGDV